MFADGCMSCPRYQPVTSRSSAAPSGPLARPWDSQHSALRITSTSAPFRSASDSTIAASRTSAALLDL